MLDIVVKRCNQRGYLNPNSSCLHIHYNKLWYRGIENWGTAHVLIAVP